MRKTYRSKRDAPSALDHRDILLNTDAKTSIFDAFYIQNIKQSKKEVSVCSMQFAASNKVRKRKYVKRVKDKTPPSTESTSKFTCLTPDKSIHLNRAPDLFDELLKSSPLETQKEIYSKVNTHMNLRNKKTYVREKRNKKINCWSSDDASDSDKENSIVNKNSSDIQSHQLLVENKEDSPKRIDESINNIFSNLSVFKLENSSPINLVQSPVISRIKNKRNSILSNSPFCSTPFKEKYRGKSIYYQFSPILGKNLHNPLTIFESEKINEANDSTKNIEVTIDSINDEARDLSNGKKNEESIVSHNSVVKSAQNISSVFETTEREPFLGFRNDTQNNTEEAASEILKITLNDDEPDEAAGSSCKDNYISSTNATSNSISNESLYDTCSSEEAEDTEKYTISKDPVVIIDKLSASIFDKYYREMPDSNSEGSHEEERISLEDIRNSEDSKSTQSSYNSLDDEVSFNESLEDNEIIENINESNNETDSLSSNSNFEETCVSFVTTRRGNKATNDFTILTVDTSFTFNKNLNALNDVTEIEEENVNCDKIDNTDISNREQENLVKDSNENVDINIPTQVNVPRKSSYKIDNYNTIATRKSSRLTRVVVDEATQKNNTTVDNLISDIFNNASKPGIVLQPGKKWERSLSIYRRMTTMADHFDQSLLDQEDLKRKGRKYRQSVICTMEMQESNEPYNDAINSRRSTFASRPCRPSIKLLKANDVSRLSICSTSAHDDLQGFLNEDCDDTVIELSKLSIADCDPEDTVIENVHEASQRVLTAREYVLRRCDQTDAIPFDECYPDTALKNCRKIGEGVYGEVFLWRARDGQARVLKVIPVAGSIKVNGEHQKDFGEIISEIVIAMELSALRTPIAQIEQHLDEGKNVETLDLHSVANATDVFNKVIGVHCVYGSYPSRLLDLWELYDETKGSENDNPATLPEDQQYIVLELANAGQDLESYQFNNAEQAYSIFIQVAYGLAVAEESFQFEHRDLHWGNVLIQPTDEKYATFVLRGRSFRVPRRGVAATVIDYSLSRVALRGERARPVALYHDLAADEELFNGRGDYQFELYRLMRRALGNNWEDYEPYTNVLWLHYTIDKMITALRYTRTNTKIHKHHITKLQVLKDQLLEYRSATEFVLTHNEL